MKRDLATAWVPLTMLGGMLLAHEFGGSDAGWSYMAGLAVAVAVQWRLDRQRRKESER